MCWNWFKLFHNLLKISQNLCKNVSKLIKNVTKCIRNCVKIDLKVLRLIKFVSKFIQKCAGKINPKLGHLVRFMSVHWKNCVSISSQIKWDMIVVTIFLSILNQIEFNLVQNRKENCHHDHIPFDVKGNRIRVFSVRDPIKVPSNITAMIYLRA